MTKCQAVRTGSVESYFIDGYQHYIGNSNNCRRLAGTAGESARTIHAPSSVTCAYRPHMHTRCTTDARLRHARTSTTRLRPGATNAPRLAPPTASRRLLRQLRAKAALPAHRLATLASCQLQREEEGVAISLPSRHSSALRYRTHVRCHPPVESSRPPRQSTRNPAKHCQLRVRKQRLEMHGSSEQQQGEGTERLGRRARAAHLAKRLPTSTMPKRMSKIWKSGLEYEVDLAHSAPSRKSPRT